MQAAMMNDADKALSKGVTVKFSEFDIMQREGLDLHWLNIDSSEILRVPRKYQKKRFTAGAVNATPRWRPSPQETKLWQNHRLIIDQISPRGQGDLIEKSVTSEELDNFVFAKLTELRQLNVSKIEHPSFLRKLRAKLAKVTSRLEVFSSGSILMDAKELRTIKKSKIGRAHV